MRGDHPAGDVHVLVRSAAEKQQQDVATGDVEGAEAFVREEDFEAQDFGVELLRPRQIVDVKGSFYEAVEPRHSVQFMDIWACADGTGEAR